MDSDIRGYSVYWRISSFSHIKPISKKCKFISPFGKACIVLVEIRKVAKDSDMILRFEPENLTVFRNLKFQECEF